MPFSLFLETLEEEHKKATKRLFSIYKAKAKKRKIPFDLSNSRSLI